MLARMTSLLYLIAMKDSKAEAICQASDAMMQVLMPSDWVGRKETPEQSIGQHMQQFEAVVAKAFG